MSIALRTAAEQAPGTTMQLAERACVGKAVARYTVSRMLSRGVLVKGSGWPPVLSVAQLCEQPPNDARSAFLILNAAWMSPINPAEEGEG